MRAKVGLWIDHRKAMERSRFSALARSCAADCSNRPVEDWGKLLGDVAAVGGLLDASSTMPTSCVADPGAGT
jgi:hypothetical protein